MQSLFVLACIVVAATAQVDPQMEYDRYPEWYISEPQQRYRRDLTIDRKTGDVTLDKKSSDGRVFGTLGSRDEALFGKAGIEQNIFNDDRGKLDGSAYGTRVLGATGDSSNFGGRLDWKKDNVGASLDISKQIHGHTAVEAAAGGRWPVGKNGDFSVDGTYSRVGPIQDYGAKADFNLRW